MSDRNTLTDAVAAALETVAKAVREAATAPAPSLPATGDSSHPAPPIVLPWSVLLWREDLVPDATLLTVPQLAEAMDWSRAAIYRRTSRWHREHGSCAPLPHVRVAGLLRFPAGELRRWLAAQTERIVTGRGPVMVTKPRVGRFGVFPSEHPQADKRGEKSLSPARGSRPTEG